MHPRVLRVFVLFVLLSLFNLPAVGQVEEKEPNDNAGQAQSVDKLFSPVQMSQSTRRWSGYPRNHAAR